MINISVNVKDALKVVFQETKTIFIVPGESFSLLASKLSPLVIILLLTLSVKSRNLKKHSRHYSENFSGVRYPLDEVQVLL